MLGWLRQRILPFLVLDNPYLLSNNNESKGELEEAPILQVPTTIKTSPVGERPKQPERSAAEEVALAGAKGTAEKEGQTGISANAGKGEV